MEIKGYKDFYKQDKLSIYNMDNMELMKQIPDKYFDISIVDPPYGIDRNNMTMGNSIFNKDNKKWDIKTPSKEYFLELFRISENQVIWGGNYFELPITKYFAIWDKGETMYMRDFAEAEFAWVKKGGTRIYKKSPNQLDRIHPTQKPISLYSWILEKYAKEGMKIFDSHLGSGSNAIACHYAKMEFIGCELDSDYYNSSIKRIKENTRQLSLLNLE